MRKPRKPEYTTVLQAMKAAKAAFEAGKAYKETPASLAGHAANCRSLAAQLLRMETSRF